MTLSTQIVVDLRPLDVDGNLVLSKLPLRAPYRGKPIRIPLAAYQAALEHSAAADPNMAVRDIPVHASRVVRRAEEEKLCQRMFKLDRPLVGQYSFLRQDKEFKRVALSKGACQSLASALADAGNELKAAEKLMELLGAIGEIHSVETPVSGVDAFLDEFAF